MAEPLFVKFLKRTFPQRFLIAKLTRTPVFGGIIDHMLFEGDNMIYLPKDQVIEMNRLVESIGEMVLPSRVAEHFIEKELYRKICVHPDQGFQAEVAKLSPSTERQRRDAAAHKSYNHSCLPD